MSNNSKRYKCPYCEYRGYRQDLITHVEKDHEDMIPKEYTPARIVYNTINKKDHGSCMICHKETKWDENKQRYDTLCKNPKCKKQYVEIVRSRMVHKYGTYNLLKDPNFQKKMLEGRSISGKYKFEDGGSIGYVGSYEKKFLEFMDKFLHIKSYDIISPGPNIPYKYKGEEHIWITDFLYEPYNLVFDIKDGGDNPNTRDMKEYREKQIAKEKAIAEYGDYNYIRLTDNKFEQLILLMMELKEKDDEKPIIRINESMNEFFIEDRTLTSITPSNILTKFPIDLTENILIKAADSAAHYTKWCKMDDGRFCNVQELKYYGINLDNAIFYFAKYVGDSDTLKEIIKSCNENNSFEYGKYEVFSSEDEQWLYGKITELYKYERVDSSTIQEETRIDDDKVPENIYHISTVNHDGETFEPRYYDNDNIKKDMERRVKRVCFSDSINGAFYSIFPNGAYDIDLFVHVPNHDVKVYATTSDDIYDSDITHELWVKEPVEMKCIGKIHVSGISGKYHILEVDKDKSGYAKRKYYEPRWNWVEKYDKESIKEDGNNPSVSAVYFTKEITSKSLQKIYHAMNHELRGNVAIKISTGELGGHNFLSPNLIKDLVKELNGTIVECNTAYEGHRNTSKDHWDTIKKHGFLDIAKVDIMDEYSDMALPVENGYHLSVNHVGNHIKDYDSVLMLSHFKGHTMAGYGGALKNMSIGMASSKGKLNIHTAGEGGDMMKADRNKFLESMVDADQSIMNYFGRDNILYINVANNLSVDCDCASHPKDPEISDIGIFASTDPVALDKACIDAVYNHPDLKKKSLINRIESRNGTHTIDCTYNHNLGNKDYTIIDIDELTEDM